jgi:hypothetical protein
MTRFIALVCVLAAQPAAAQNLPPHTPGAICIIPGGWCWAAPTGFPGQDCSCPTSSGWVVGSLG